MDSDIKKSGLPLVYEDEAGVVHPVPFVPGDEYSVSAVFKRMNLHIADPGIPQGRRHKKKSASMQLPGLIQFRQCTLSDYELCDALSLHLEKMYTYPASVPPRNIPARPNEDFDLLLGELIFRVVGRTPNSYLLFFDEKRDQEVCAVATKYENGRPCSWAVRRGLSCMGKSDGAFVYEPQPSSRDDDFFAEYRFSSFEEAEHVYLSFHPR